MNTTILTKSVKLTPALDQYTRYKVAKVAKFIDESTGVALAEIDLGKTTDHHRRGEIFRAEINLQIPGQSLLRAEATHYDLYVAIVTARDELIRQVKNTNSKQLTLTRKGARKLKDRLRFWR